MFKKIVVGVSGGVDSAVAALLLKQKGFEVTGVFMKNWDTVNEFGECQAEKDYADAEWACKKIDIPLVRVDFVKEYWTNVFSYFISSYEKGITPNPDIQCNQKIKFDKFIHYAMEKLNAEAVATGHYACTSFGPYLELYKPNSDVLLLKSIDQIKDQTFFLSQVSQEALRKCMFPLGNLLKQEVKRIAADSDLYKLVNKKESMGICFIGKRNLKEFMQEYIEDKEGDFIDIENGIKVGKHQGLHHWTIGQKCRIAGTPKRYYVALKDKMTNNIYVVQGSNHPALFTECIVTHNIHWINKEPDELSNSSILECEFVYQRDIDSVPCTIYKTKSQKLFIKTNKPLRAITPGQFAVLYIRNECLGSSEIIHAGPSYFIQDRYSEDLVLDKKKKHIVFI